MQVLHAKLAPLDIVGLALVGLLLLLGLYRGLWWQVIRLVGVTVSVLIARAVSEPLADRLLALFPGLQSRTAFGLAWGTLFLTAMLACALLGMAGQRMLDAMKLNLSNRLAGACAGAVTGFCAHVVLVVLVCHLAPPKVLGRYVVGTYSERLYSALGVRWSVVMAAEGAREVDQALDKSPRSAKQ
jgi:membrane protein required for colicin V production